MQLQKELISNKAKQKKGFALLIDPDKTDLEGCQELLDLAKKSPPDYFFVGGSLITTNRLEAILLFLKEQCDIPVLIFPGSLHHISPVADGILLLSLISGRNPEYLIGQHVQAAPLLKKSNLEVLSTGYMLVDCGQQTTVSYISDTKPLPYQKHDIALCTALAGEMLGQHLIYMDGGSGAAKPISPEMISTVASELKVPLLIGGGIRNAEQARIAYEAGADVLVVGTAFEEDPSFVISLAEVRNRLNHKLAI